MCVCVYLSVCVTVYPSVHERMSVLDLGSILPIVTLTRREVQQTAEGGPDQSGGAVFENERDRAGERKKKFRRIF